MRDFRDFFVSHWGDIIALYLIHLGLVVIWQAHGDTDVAHVGESFILLGAGTLRFKSHGPNGNGDKAVG